MWADGRGLWFESMPRDKTERSIALLFCLQKETRYMDNSIKTIRETPDSVCRTLIEMAALSDRMKVLEPSAGEGKIIKYLDEHYSFIDMEYHMIELNQEKCDRIPPFMKSCALPIIQRADFLKIHPGILFDRIISCPPFKANIDLAHIQKMHTHLKPKGLLVSLTNPFWVTNNELHQAEFRAWLTDKNYYMRMLPDNSFMEKGRSAPTAILKIYKH